MSAGALLEPARERTGLRRSGRVDHGVAGAAALTLLAAVLRFALIGHQGFWFDEANTAQLVHLSPGRMLGLIPQSESTPPLYYLLAWAWARVFGFGEAPLRSLSAVAGVATVPVVFALGRRAVSERAGLLAAALATTSPLLVWYAQEARSYALLVLLSAASLLAALRLAGTPSRRAAVLWALVAGLALATHYYAALVVVPEALWLLVRHRRRVEVACAVAAVAVCGCALVPLALSQTTTGNANWIAAETLGRRLSQLTPQFLAGFQPPAPGILVPLAGVAAAVGLTLGGAVGGVRDRRALLGFAALALVGLVLTLVLVAAGTDDLLTRNLLALWPPAALALACACAAPRLRGAGVLAVAVVCAVGVAGTVAVDLDRNRQRPDWRVVASALGARPAQGERAILVQHDGDLLPLSLYLPGLRRMRHRGARVRELDVVSFTDPPSGGFCWWGSACNLYPSVMQPSYRIAGFAALWRRHVLQFTVLRLVAAAPVRVTPAAVARALTATTLGRDELLVQRRR